MMVGVSFILSTDHNVDFRDIFSFIFKSLPSSSAFAPSLLISIIFPLYLAYTLQHETVKVSFTNKQEFLNKFNTWISEIKYCAASNTGNVFTYKKTSWFSGGILLKGVELILEEDKATISGPMPYIKKIKKSF